MTQDTTDYTEGNFWWFTPVFLGISSILFGLIGRFVFGFIGGQEGLVGVWVGVLFPFAVWIIFGFKIIPKQNYYIIERFGKLYRIAHNGPRVLLFPGIIDEIVREDHIKYKELRLYKDDPDNQIDFKNGSAPITASVWYRVGEHDHVTSINKDAINVEIIKYHYLIDEPEERIDEVFDDAARPELQKLTIDEAQVSKNQVGKTIAEERGDTSVSKSLEHIGVYLMPHRGFVISDIVLSEEIRALRRQKLEGEKDAELAEARGHGYSRAILAIIADAKEADHKDITWNEATEIYNTQRGLETISESKANITFVSPDIKGMLVSVGAGSSKQGGAE